MDISAVSALNVYNYQTALKTSTPASALLQTLVQVYGGSSDSATNLFPPVDSLAALAGSGSLNSLISGIYNAAQASSDTTLPLSLNSSSTSNGVTELLNSLTPSSSQGFGSYLNPDVTAALAAYQ
jgi:hypothetical protein